MGYYIRFTVFVDKALNKPVERTKDPIGVDSGCAVSFNQSDGTKVDVRVMEPKRLKTLQRNLKRYEEGSINYRKTCE